MTVHKRKPQIHIVSNVKRINGLDLAWLEAGQSNKPMMIFLHGFPDTAHVWEKQIRHFAASYHVVAPFLRGVGKSAYSFRPSNMTLDRYVKDIIDLLKTIHPKSDHNVVVCGHDIGTSIAWNLAHKLGNRAKSLIVINGAHELQFLNRMLSKPKQFIKSWYMYFFFLPLIPELTLSVLPNNLLSSLILKFGSSQPLANDGIKHTHRLVTQYKFILWSTFKQRFNLKKSAKLNIPVLSISSLGDKFVEPASQREIEPFAQDITIKIVEGQHWVQFQNPELINTEIESFLDRLD